MPRRAIILSCLVLILISLPYLFAWINSGPDYVFGGFLFNPLDGHSYQAKMYQGWQGSWRYHLPFTAEPGEGIYINFLFYLFLGHVSRWLSLPIVLVFHLARLLGSAALLFSLWRFLKLTGPEGSDSTWRFGLAALGLGLGWLLFPFGLALSDLWVAETYPILSMYANPHFPLSLAIMLWLLLPPEPQPAGHPLTWFNRIGGWSSLAALLLAILLSILSPFGVVICLLVLGVWLLWELVERGRVIRLEGQPVDVRQELRRWWKEADAWPAPLFVRSGIVALGGLPCLIYYQWSVRVDPVMAVWNAQNLTLTPAAWDVLLALSPAMILAVWGAIELVRRGPRLGRILAAWLIFGLIFIYLPLNLQRRFMMGLFIPTVGLAGYALDRFRRTNPARVGRIAAWAFGLSLPSLVLLLVVSFFGILTHAAEFYLARSEVQALEWITVNTPANALILASPDSGALIPAYTGRRVIYGHPYETANAEAEKAALEQFFTAAQVGGAAPAQFLERRGVDFIFYGPREQKVGPLPAGLALQPVYQSGDVTIYRWSAAP